MPEASDDKKSRDLELFVLSLVSLYLELLAIRWLSSDFRAFTVFKTFPLVTCFVGLGLGYAIARDRLFRLAPWAMLQFVVVLQILEFFGFWQWTFPSLGIFTWELETMVGPQLLIYLVGFILTLVLLLSGPFALLACVGARLGSLFNASSPLPAYCINIAGAITGSILFTVLSFLGLPPWALLLPAAVVLAVYVKEIPRWQRLAVPAVAVALATLTFTLVPGCKILWSPYHRLEILPYIQWNRTGGAPLSHQGLMLGANRHFYQYACNLSDSNLEDPSVPAKFRKYLREHRNYYDLAYRLIHPRTVLVLGAGTGNDVAAALRNGAERVDAVDIDPVIIDVGRKSHPERPYDSPKVTVYCDDARNFLQHCRTRYDLIVFAGLDSQTVAGQGASVRTDLYVYTIQSVRQALGLLQDDGLIFLSFCKSREWLTNRLYSTLSEAAGYPPLVLLDSSHPGLNWEVFLTGPAVKDGKRVTGLGVEPFALEPIPPGPRQRTVDDDWPYLYVTPVAFDYPYLLMVAVILAISAYATRKFVFHERRPLSWQMFFLGAAFLLLELQAISRLSLIYGSTWLTSSIVINAVLVMILGANLVVIKVGDRWTGRQAPFYGLLFASLAASYLLPVSSLSQSVAGQAVVTAVTVLPMLSAAVIFALAFKGSDEPGRALAFNLLGAVLGAMLEYLSNYVGINNLVLVAALLYLISFGFSRAASRANAPQS